VERSSRSRADLQTIEAADLDGDDYEAGRPD